jgi:FkbM family methyltransferase
VALDVGSNNGDWVQRIISPIMKRAGARGLHPHTFILEPQAVFAPRLTKLVERMGNATFIQAAAWKENTTLPWTEQGGSTSASLLRSKDKGSNTVAAVDLAELIERATRPGPGGGRVVTLLKFDVEGAEYKLLPWLLLQGALCRTTHLLFEWHLGIAPPEERLAGLSLRIALDAMLREGCPVPPRAVLHDEFGANNLEIPVPGLRELAVQRQPSFRFGEQSHVSAGRWTHGRWATDRAHLAARRAEERPEQRGVGRMGRPLGDSPRCYGACPTRCYDDPAWINASEASYKRAWRGAINTSAELWRVQTGAPMCLATLGAAGLHDKLAGWGRFSFDACL